LQIVTREDEDALYMFLWNYENNGGENDSCETDIVLEGLYVPYVLDAWSGEISTVPVYSIEDGKTRVPVSVTYRDAAVYIFKASDSEAPHLVAGEGAEIVAKDGRYYVRATEEGKYTLTANDGTLYEFAIGNVPTARELRKWSVKIESWDKPDTGDTSNWVSRTETHDVGTGETTTTEGYWLTRKTEIDLELDELETWDNIEEAGREVSGIGYYETSFDWDPDAANGAWLYLGPIVQTATVMVNGEKTEDVNINKAVVNITPLLKAGSNELKITVTTSLTNRQLANGYGNLTEGVDTDQRYDPITDQYQVFTYGDHVRRYFSNGLPQALLIPYIEEGNLGSEPPIDEDNPAPSSDSGGGCDVGAGTVAAVLMLLRKRSKLKKTLLFSFFATVLCLSAAPVSATPAVAVPVEWTPERTAFHPESWTEYNGRKMFTEADIPSFIKNKQTTFNGVTAATGATVTKEELLKEDISKYKIVTIIDAPYNATPGARDTRTAWDNTKAIDQALKDVSAAGGGTVKIPKGEFSFYTIHLQSDANIWLAEGAIILGALPSAKYNYDPPEINIYKGLNDFGHAHFANSLIYGINVHDVMIYGEGLISGSYFNPETGYRFTTLHNMDFNVTQGGNAQRTDPDWIGTSWMPAQAEIDAISPYGVTAPGQSGFFKTANKAIALEKCQRIVLSGFDMLNVGHFAFISAGVDDCLIENIVIDSNRDGFDIDTIKNLTLRNCVVNTFQDDAIVVKTSFGVREMFKTENILIYNCVVSGYDSGSVMNGTFTESRPSGSASNPHGRFKIGTESTAGFDRVTVVNLLTVRSSGFAAEAVDGAPLTNLIGYNLYFDNSHGGPIFVTIGDRSRTPVTGKSKNDSYGGADKERIENSIFVLPNTAHYAKYPIQRYQPSYGQISGSASTPVTINYNNFWQDPDTGECYLYKWNGGDYGPDLERGAIPESEMGRYGNAIGAKNLAVIENVYFGNVKATDTDPRVPIDINGLVSSKIKNVTLENIDVSYRGGLSLRHAVEQYSSRSENFTYNEYMCPPATSSYSYTVGSGFPRMRQIAPGEWAEDPYNVPENVTAYPEPINFGVLPAYGLYARHVDGLTVKNFKTSYETLDDRPAIVLDDVQNGQFSDVDVKSEGTDVVTVTHRYKRPTNFEFYPNEPYIETTTQAKGLSGLRVRPETIEAPEPGTPPDELYSKETAVANDAASGYMEQRTEYPRTVNRPWLKGAKNQTVKAGEVVTMKLEAVNPADYTEEGPYAVTITCEAKPEGSTFADNTFTWKVAEDTEPGPYYIKFVLTDGVLPVSRVARVDVQSFSVDSAISSCVLMTSDGGPPLCAF
jgi:polygalacturonase